MITGKHAMMVAVAALLFGVLGVAGIVFAVGDALEDDHIWIGSANDIAVPEQLDDCSATSNHKLQYDASLNDITCDSTAPGSSITTQEDNADNQTVSQIDWSTGIDRAHAAGEDVITVDPSEFGADWIDAVTDATAGVRSGTDATFVTGTAGTSGNCVEWNADGDVVDAGAACGVGGGGGDEVTVNSTAVDTTANLLDGDIDFTHVDGGPGGPDNITATVGCTDCVALATETTGNYVADITAGTYIDVSGGGAENATVTVDVDLTELTTQTIGSGSDVTLTFNGSGTGPNDPVFLAGNGVWLIDQAETVLASSDTGTIGDGTGDLYVGDEFEVDGVAQFDGAVTTNSTLTASGNVTLDDGVGDTPAMIFNPATGTTWSIDVVDSTDDMRIYTNTGSAEELDIVNNGAGTVNLTLDGTLQLSALDCTGNTNGGALTTDASGNVSCSDDDGGAGSGDNVTVNSTAADTTANFLDGDIDWTLVDGGAGGPDDITATVACSGCVDVTDIGANAVDGSELVDDSVDTTELDDTEAPATGQLVATDNVTSTRLEYIAVGAGLTHDGDTLSADLGTSVDISDETNLAAGGTLLDLVGDTVTFDEGTLTDEAICTYEGTGTELDCTLDTKAELETAIGDVADFAEADGDTFTGAHDFGGATSLEVPNGAGGTTVNAAGEVTIDTTSDTINFYDGTAERVLNPIKCGGIAVEDPGAAEDISVTFTPFAVTITEMRAVLVGSATPSVTWTIRHGTDRNAAGAEVVTSGTTTTSTTTGSDVTAFNDATIVADSFVWMETTAQSGTVDEININICWRQDA